MDKICDVCNFPQVELFVSSVPGVPLTIARCKHCVEKDLYPLSVLIANTACCGDKLADTASWWQELVNDNLEKQGKTVEWFDEQVKISAGLYNYIEGK